MATRRHVAKTSSTLQRAARERADNEARRVPWQELLEARNHYIDWQEFSLWVRSVLEVEHSLPASLREVLDDRCPGFLKKEGRGQRSTSKRPLHLCLEDWIDDEVFGSTKKSGWFNAVAYYAIRDPRYQKAEACWSECVKKWKRVKPIRYPSFDEWKRIVAHYDGITHLSSGARTSRASLPKSVDPGRLADAVSRYIDWEAFAYWARAALESSPQLPDKVAAELSRRCPGFVEALAREVRLSFSSRTQTWARLMSWIADHFFRDAQNEGWFDAILTQARNYPRAIRTMEYADDCDEVDLVHALKPYPSFQEWRKQADSYVPSAD
jgi:hypothetical protein